MSHRFEPQLISIFREGYSWHQFVRDVTAGVLVGIVALPLAIAFGIASGVKPEQGLYTAIIAGFVISALGGSRAQVSGPTGAFIVVVAGIVHEHGYEGLALATLMAGVMLIAMGLLKMGVLLKFVPYPLTVGFTAGIALIIFSSQVKDFLGLPLENMPVDFLSKWTAIGEGLSSFNPWALAVGLSSLFIIIFSRTVSAKIPGPLCALVVSTLCVQYFNIPVETIGSKFAAVPSQFPSPHFDFQWSLAREMFGPAVTIAMLAGIESLLSAVVADGMMGSRHRSNMELVALGIGNVISPIFRGIPATGAIARTATNIKNGGRTPIAGMVHAIVLLFIMLCAGQYAEKIPMASLAAILIVVAYNMSEWRGFIRVLRYPKSDVLVLCISFILTVLVDLTVAIGVGIGLAAFLFVQRMEETAGARVLTDELRAEGENGQRDYHRSDLPPYVEVFEVFGPMFFSAVDRFQNALARIEKPPEVMILYMKRVPNIDGTGLQAIESLQARMKLGKGAFLIAGASGQARTAILKAKILLPEFVVDELAQAIEIAKGLHS